MKITANKTHNTNSGIVWYALLSLLIFIFSISFVSADVDYSKDKTFRDTTATSYFNTGFDEAEASIYSLSLNPYNTDNYDDYALGEVIVDDIDGDSYNEIITTDEKYIYILNASGGLFNIETVIELPAITTSTDQLISNMLVMDIDDDGNKEIIIAYTGDGLSNRNLTIYDFNGSLQQTVSSTGTMSATGRTLLMCDDVDNVCMILPEGDNTGTAIKLGYYEYGMDRINSTRTDYGVLEGSYSYAFPSEFYNDIEDIDNDGTNEFHISFASKDSSNNVIYRIVRLLADTTAGNFTTDQVVEVEDVAVAGLDATSFNAPNKYVSKSENIASPKTITMPYIADFVTGGNKEYAIGFTSSYSFGSSCLDFSSQYKIYTFTASGSFIDDHPEVDTGDGIIISNIAKANHFKGSGQEACILGHDLEDNESEIVCFGEETQEIPETRTYRFSSSFEPTSICAATATNMVQKGSDLSNTLYMLEAESALRGAGYNGNIDESVNTFGTVSLNDDGCILGFCTGEIIFASPYENALLYPVDYFGTGHIDYIYKTSTNLFMYTDGYRNIGCDEQYCASEITINPSTRATWLINTTLEIRITTQEIDNDDVRANVYLYYASGNQQLVNTSFYPAGSTLVISSLKVNKTTDAGYLRIELEDDENLGLYDIIELSFSVSDEYGIEFGDAIETISFEEAAVEEEQVLDETGNELDVNDNPIKDFFDIFGIASRLGYTAGWLLVIVLVSLWLIGEDYIEHKKLSANIITFTLILDYILLIIGVVIQFVPVSIFITITVLILIVAGLFFKSLFNGGG